MPPEITVDFINRSTDTGNSQVVLFETAEGPPRHTLRFHNRSGRTQTFVCFQPTEHNSANGYPIAWFAMPVASGVQVNFRWQPTFDLVWMETGKLAPGIQAMASQVIPASLGSSNMAYLSYIDEAFAFHNQGPGDPPADLIIRTDTTIPQNTVSVGIGMAGAPTQVLQTQANLNTVFTAVPNYWVAIADVVQGEVLDESELAAKAPVVFPPNVTAMTATLDADQKFVVQQGLVV
ncbi:hypothetical protein FNL55_02545 [Tardiphaga sp. vice352]|uniref:hypothetical protein n=1 Tax=unclassified Tardiphaga TaxID=2631404 RepID=UPI001165062A|nr:MULTISPECIES: hypothetical protein [unclassified Tardiphaga]QDM14952.1 hypothetical protein FNL53_02540 [Tardiphaga sp. vice278]QDM20060.1 hypothetical protein FIU28_02010 [Tardiphaga sp. vice154]QDM25132.1 hypothetical protein FNL56_02450 [Tardiphaga sp. vice304]QDM30343.1 hypothetical protein FNL55_02545 [Tardiphaga sp. vice352]